MPNIPFHFAREERSVESRQEAHDLGVTGEEMAARYLTDKGFIILEKNYRPKHSRHEIDLIALDKGDLVIVEVKTRSGEEIMKPEDAVNHEKRGYIMQLANQYVRSNQRTENVRFDIVAIIKNNNGTEIRHHVDAFNVFNW